MKESKNSSESAIKRSTIKLNWLRAAVLGANDGIVSVSAIIMGVAGASNSLHFILTAGIAGMTGGALSMAVGEYVSVSTQRDKERLDHKKENQHLGEAELSMYSNTLSNPWHAAGASGAAFLCGAVIPLLAIFFSPVGQRVPITFMAVIAAFILTGILSAKAVGGGSIVTVVRIILGGALAMAITFSIGRLFGVTGI